MLHSDSFNLMPIIEHLQFKWRKKQRRLQRKGGNESRCSRTNSEELHRFPSTELGKQPVREGDDFLARPVGHRKVMITEDSFSLSAEIDGGQSRQQQ